MFNAFAMSSEVGLDNPAECLGTYQLSDSGNIVRNAKLALYNTLRVLLAIKQLFVLPSTVTGRGGVICLLMLDNIRFI